MSPITEQVFLASPEVTARGRVITSPFQFAFTGEDRLVVLDTASVGTPFVLTMRFIDDAGEIDVARHEFLSTGDRVTHSHQIPMGRGVVSNLVVRPIGPAVQPGQWYATVFVARGGAVGALVFIGQILGGYATLQQPLAWPGSPIIGGTEGNGALVAYSLPGAATLGLETIVPLHTRWAPLMVTADFVTGAVVAEREVTVAYVIPLNVTLGWFRSRVTQAASQLRHYTFARGIDSTPTAGASFTIDTSLPTETALDAGSQVTIFAAGFQLGDSWDFWRITVREWLSP